MRERARGIAGRGLGLVAQLLGFAEVLELLQRLVLDLADPLTGNVERPPDLVKRPRALAAEPVAQLEHPPLAIADVLQCDSQGFPGQDLGCALVRRLGLFVGDELAELGLVLVADRLLERDRRPRGVLDRLDLAGLDPGEVGDLRRGRLATERRDQAALGAADLVELLDDVDRDPDRPRLVRQRPRNRLPDPPVA